ncbi:MAG: hypothetical protein LBT24_01500 [Tannerella sp.]|jgi:hypothetical protein|nr:hypothetical protein [Tannerella sp.]
MSKLYLIFIVFLFNSCVRYSPEIEDVLKQAGDNRGELEKVLKHYAENPADSLKLRAAEFLIVNMPGKYSKYYDAPWNDVATAMLRWTSSSDKQLVSDTYRLGKQVIREDVKHITADFLMNNIEPAFQSWQDKPWGKDVSFDTFCEEILPYRVGTELLENWREKALASFADFNKSFQADSTISVVEACTKVNGKLPQFSLDWDFPEMNYTMLMSSRRGNCDRMAVLSIFVMRALGIPVTFDYTPRWFEENIGHAWNAVCDSAGRHISFMGTETAPGELHAGIEKSRTKTIVYRRTFALQIHRPDSGFETAWESQAIHSKDVSLEYDGFINVHIPVCFPHPKSNKVYLAVWTPTEWRVIGYANADSFPVAEKMLYMPVHSVNKELLPSNYPFMFEGANQPDFSDAKILYKIKNIPGDRFQVAKIRNTRTFRYIRYVSPKDKEANCNVAEIKIFDATGSILQGKPTGTPETHLALPTMTFDKAFDGDLSTFFDAKSNDSWTGLDLGKPCKIGEIHYAPRNEGAKGIYDGHTYELFYWDGKIWKSLGQKKATIKPLQYQVPANALFIIKNNTTEKTGIPFIVQDGVQKWVI